MEIRTLLQKIKRFLVPLLIVVVALAAFLYMKSTKPEQPPVEVKEKVWLVETLPARFAPQAPIQRLYGEVVSSARVVAAAPIAAVVSEVRVKEGQSFQAGDLLLRLSAEDLLIPLQQAKAEVADVKAQLQLERLAYQANKEKLAHERRVLDFKRADVTRVEELLKKKLTSLSALEQAKEALARQEYTVVGAELAVREHALKAEQNQARLDKAQAALRQAELNRTRGEVVAPYDGRIATLKVSEGDRVNAGAVLLEFYGLASLELRATLPVTSFQDVHQRLQAGEAVEALYTSPGATLPRALKADRLAGLAATSGVDIFFSLPAELQAARPGELLQVDLQGKPHARALALPYSAIYGNDRVYVVEGERLQAKTVRLLGEKMVDGALWALVQADFAEGSRVVVTHLPNAVSGLKVAEVAL